MKTFFSLMLLMVLALSGLDAEAARRLGGGKSIGQQSSNVTQRNASPAAPVQNQNATPGSPAGTATPAPGPRRPWGAMLGGLAAGLGLAWLANSLGLGAAFGQILLIGLLVLAVMLVIGLWTRGRARASTSMASRPLAFGTAGSGPAVTTPMPRTYSPDHVGNDASARPWERDGGFRQAAGGGSIIGSALAGPQGWGIPPGFDTEGFLAAAKRNFVTLQQAWDRADVDTLRSMMTDGMLSEIRSQLAEREKHGAGQPNQTDVVMLDAQLLGIEDLGDGYLASVEFNGMIREEPSSGPSPFREVWNMSKPKDGGSGWLVAGVQALQ